MTRICIFPRVEGIGGIASFRLKFEAGLAARGYETTNNLNDPYDVLLILAGTRDLPALWGVKRRGVRIVQRLDGINWVQRVRWAGVRYTVRAEYGNAMLAFFRSHIAGRVVYQSQFIRKWWEEWYGIAKVPAYTILNGVDLKTYNPEGDYERPTDRFRMLVLEGNLKGGLDTGLFHAISLAEKLSGKYPMEVVVAGGVDQAAKNKIKRRKPAKFIGRVPVKFPGTLPREEIPHLIRSSHLMFSAEVNPPCPNSVIEALACGLPVAGFDSGALRELVGEEAGRIVPYGGDPWKLDPPDIDGLAEAAEEILEDQPRFRKAARARAESVLGVDRMVDEYLKVLVE